MAKATHEDEPKELSVVEELELLETKIRSYAGLIKAGSKSDIDQAGAKLIEFADKVKDVLERKTS